MTDATDGQVGVPAWQPVYVAACAGVIAFCLAYGLVDYAHIPRLFHYQAERELRLEARGEGPAPAGYVGLWTWALVAGALAAGAAYLAVRARRRPIGDSTLVLWLAWSMTAFALVGAYFTWNNWP